MKENAGLDRDYNDGKYGGHVFTCDECSEFYRGAIHRKRAGLCRLCKKAREEAALDPNRPAIVCCKACNGMGAFYEMEPPYSPIPTPCEKCKGKSMYIVNVNHPEHPNYKPVAVADWTGVLV